MISRHVSVVSVGCAGASLPSGNAFYCPLGVQGHSRSNVRASLEDKASGKLLIRAFESVTAWFFKECSARIVRWETLGLLVGCWVCAAMFVTPSSILRASRGVVLGCPVTIRSALF